MLKKIISLLTAVSLVLMLCSCNSDIGNLIYKATSEEYGDTGGLSLPIDVEGTTVSIMLSSAIQDLEDKMVIKELCERTGIDINIINVPSSEMSQETKVLLSTNDLPDILCQPMDIDEINALGVKGTFVPINKYLNELPNFTRVFIENKEYSEVFDTYAASDNNLYIFPGYESQQRAENVMLYRKDVFDKHGVRMWNNKDGFYKALKDLKRLYPDSIPFTSKRGSQLFSDWSLSFGIDFPGPYYDRVKKEWIYSATDERTMDMLDFIRRLYQEGLIDIDFLTISSDAWQAKMISKDKSFVTFDSLEYIDILNKKSKYEDYDLRYASPISQGPALKSNKKILEGPCISNNQNKLLSLKLLDYLLSPSGIELTTLGIKNKTYIYDSDGNIRYLGFSENKDATMEALKEKYGLFAEGLYRSLDKRSVRYSYSKEEQEAMDTIAIENRLRENDPAIMFTKEERVFLKETQEIINQKAIAFAAEYVLTSNTGQDAFEKWINEAKKLGADKIIEIYNSKKFVKGE